MDLTPQRRVLSTRIKALLMIVAYAAAAITAASAPQLAVCSTLELGHHSHAGDAHRAVGHQHGKHHPTSRARDCLNCCVADCLLGASLLPSASAPASVAFYGAVIVYPCFEIELADRSITPDPAPPKPTDRT